MTIEYCLGTYTGYLSSAVSLTRPEAGTQSSNSSLALLNPMPYHVPPEDVRIVLCSINIQSSLLSREGPPRKDTLPTGARTSDSWDGSDNFHDPVTSRCMPMPKTFIILRVNPVREVLLSTERCLTSRTPAGRGERGTKFNARTIFLVHEIIVTLTM